MKEENLKSDSTLLSSSSSPNPLPSPPISSPKPSNQITEKKNEEIKEVNKKEKIIRYLFKRPKTFSSNEHRHENWMELFLDLLYVAFFVKLGVIIHTCGSTSNILVFVVTVFTGVYMSKFDFDQYMNKFTSEDLVHKLFFAVYLLGLSLMVLDVNESSEVSPSPSFRYYLIFNIF